MYDILIIGAGPAGMTAGIYGIRGGKSVVMLEAVTYGGQTINTPEIENYPAIKTISGMEFAENLYKQVSELGGEIKYEKANKIEKLENGFKVSTEEGKSYEARSVIIATGAKNRPLGVAQEDRYRGAGISYCATCDGAFFRNKKVAVVGGGNTALEDGEVLSDLCEKVYIVHRRDEFRGDAANLARLKEKSNVEFVLNSTVEGLIGDAAIRSMTVKNKIDGSTRNLEVDGIFVAIGQMPDNKDFSDMVELDGPGYVSGQEDCKTNTDGIFVAGDCRTKKVRQIATAVGDGAVAGLAAVEYVNSLK